MTNEKPTSQQIESHHFDLESVDREFDQALEDAWQKVKEGQKVKDGEARVEYRFKDNIQDGDHLEHITFIDVDGTIIYDQDFVLEKNKLRQVDPKDN